MPGAGADAAVAPAVAPAPVYTYAPAPVPVPQMQSQPAGPGIADFAVVAATVVLSPLFVRVFNLIRFVIALIGVSFIVSAIVHFEHVRGTPAMGFATFGIFASFIGAFVFIGIAGWLGVVPGMARKFNALR